MELKIVVSFIITFIIMIIIFAAIGIVIYLFYLDSNMKEITKNIVNYLEKHFNSLSTVIKQEGSLMQLPHIVSSRSDLRLTVQGSEMTSGSLSKKVTEIIIEFERGKYQNASFDLIIKNKIGSFYSSQFQQFRGEQLDFKDRNINYRISGKTNNANEVQNYLIKDIALTKSISRINELRQFILTASRTKFKIVMQVEGIEYYSIVNCLYSLRLFLEKEKGTSYLKVSKETRAYRPDKIIRSEQISRNDSFVSQSNRSETRSKKGSFVAESLSNKYVSKEYPTTEEAIKITKEPEMISNANLTEKYSSKRVKTSKSSFKFTPKTNLSKQNYKPIYSSISVLSQGSTAVDITKIPVSALYRQIRGNIDRLGPINDDNIIAETEVTIILYTGMFDHLTFRWDSNKLVATTDVFIKANTLFNEALLTLQSKDTLLNKKELFLKPYNSIDTIVEPSELQEKLFQKKDIGRTFNKFEGKESQLVIELKNSTINVIIETIAHPRNVLIMDDLLEYINWFIKRNIEG